MAFPLKPPADWFDTPEAADPTPLTFQKDGRVYGHLALWDSCHAGLLNGAYSECVRPPKSQTGYRAFHLGDLETEDGGSVAVGKIVYAADHAPLTAGLEGATKHYDNTGAVGAFVRARNGKHGIWLSGAVRSDISEEGFRDLRVNPPSGDWRMLNRNLELIASLSVPVPGYQIPRSQMALAASAEGLQVSALILAGYGSEEEVMDRGRGYIRKRKMISKALTAAATTFTAEQRTQYAKSGVALPDGSFPIRNCQDWMDARRSVGRAAPGKRARVIAHINKRGKALGCGD